MHVYSLEAYQRTHIGLIGCGALGSHAAHALACKGARTLTLLDDDVVEATNLTRQRFEPDDVGRSKVHAAARHLKCSALFPLTVNAHPFRFQELFDANDQSHTTPFDLIINGPDNNPTRLAVSRYALKHQVPLIQTALSRDANSLYVFIQMPGDACWGCAKPQHLNATAYPCDLPGSIDIVLNAVGLITHATDRIVSGSYLPWNYRELYLDAGLADITRTINRDPDCPLCSSKSKEICAAYNNRQSLGDHNDLTT